MNLYVCMYVCKLSQNVAFIVLFLSWIANFLSVEEKKNFSFYKYYENINIFDHYSSQQNTSLSLLNPSPFLPFRLPFSFPFLPRPALPHWRHPRITWYNKTFSHPLSSSLPSLVPSPSSLVLPRPAAYTHASLHTTLSSSPVTAPPCLAYRWWSRRLQCWIPRRDAPPDPDSLFLGKSPSLTHGSVPWWNRLPPSLPPPTSPRPACHRLRVTRRVPPSHHVLHTAKCQVTKCLQTHTLIALFKASRNTTHSYIAGSLCGVMTDLPLPPQHYNTL